MKAPLAKRRQGEAGVVGLHGAAGDDGIGTLSQSVGNGEVQLTGLVAAGAAGKQVVTLHVDVHLAAKSLGEIGKIFDGGGFLHITATRELCKIHDFFLLMMVKRWSTA